MVKQLSLIALAVMLVCGCAKQNVDKENAANQPKPYQATYSSPDNFAYQTQRIYSDGRGHWRMDIAGDGLAPTIVNVLNLDTDETIAWSEEVSKYVRRPCQPMDPLVMRMKMERMPKEGQELGARVISGHRCHGWEGMDGTEVWFDDEIGCLVLATVGGVSVKMVAFSSLAPEPSMFEPPVGYTQAPTPFQYSRRSDDSHILRDMHNYMH